MTSPDEPPITRASDRRPPRAGAIVLTVSAQVTRADIPGLCEAVRMLLQHDGVTLVVCEVGAFAEPDPVALDTLAGVALTVTRLGGEVRLRNASRRLQDLLILVGLCNVLPLVDDLPSGREREGQPEQRE